MLVDFRTKLDKMLIDIIQHKVPALLTVTGTHSTNYGNHSTMQGILLDSIMSIPFFLIAILRIQLINIRINANKM